MYKRLFTIIKDIERKDLSFNSDEGWGFLKLTGLWNKSLKDDVSELLIELQKINNSLMMTIDDEPIDISDINEYDENSTWVININKAGFETNKVFYQFFYSKDKLLDWVNGVNPFDPSYPINKHEKIKIVVNELKDSVRGECLAIVNDSSNEFDEQLLKLPSEKDVNQTVHCVSEAANSIKPQNSFITSSKANDKYAEPFLRNSAAVLIASISNEFYNRNKIILRGVRRVQLNIIDVDTPISLNLLHKIGEVVSWIYEDKVETRQKLFIDRITLDVNYDLPLAAELSRVIDSAFQQAKERYNFVIIDRKENYLREVRDLLKDIKSQSDLYANKIRNLLNNLLRDVLAGFLLIGFSLFTKVSEITNLSHNGFFLDFVFKGLASYFFISAFIQVVVDITDMRISKNEMFYWKNVSREFIPVEEFNGHIKDALKNRVSSVWCLYFLIIACYIVIGLLSWNFPCIWNHLKN